jgi:hypothetical protein
MRAPLTVPAALCAILLMASSLSAQTVDFNREIRPILSNRCLACHGPDEAKRESGLRLDVPEIATKPLESGSTAIIPGDTAHSEMIARITSSDESQRMPPADFGKPLTQQEIDLLTRWIQQGAHFATHWSYVPPVRPEVPTLNESEAKWCHNAIDHFVLKTLNEQHLTPSGPADSAALVRRVFLDLIGVPPTLEEGRAWIAKLDGAGADRDAVYAELVDHLLTREEYGEHWARKWLDLARYADSSGYADDPARTIWPWRDWVIRAFNNNMPFDQFTIEQTAGDLLPNPTEDQLIATAFHRNTMTNNEGGTQDEEFRNVAVVDRVNTTMAVWMGTTIACAQCHSHKYDPITQDEFFQVFAILNNTEDADRGDDSPRMPLFSPAQKQRKKEIDLRLNSLNEMFATTSETIRQSQNDWEERFRRAPEWSVQKPLSAKRSSGGDITLRDDGSVFVAAATEKDSYIVEIPLATEGNSAGSIAAVRLEAIPSAELPGGGSGHGGGNFVVTELKAEIAPLGSTVPEARFVRVELPGSQKILSLAEVQVFSGTTNLAKEGRATQSSTDYDGPAELAIDGNTDGKYENKSVTHSAISDNPWWELDLGKTSAVDRISVWNRLGDNLAQRLSGFRLSLLNDAREVVWSQTVEEAPKVSADYAPGSTREVTWALAAADYQQAGFESAEVFDGKTEPENGWAVGGGHTLPHFLTLVPKQPIQAKLPSVLRLVIEQNSPYPNHLLGHFRISATTETGVIERVNLPAALADSLSKPKEDRSVEEQSALDSWYRDEVASELADARSERKTLQAELQNLKPDTSVPIFRELAGDQRRKTWFQFRGSYLDKGHEVVEGVPAVFPPIPGGDQINRLSFAKWLVSSDNPLTARVVANRYWENLFGRGLVLTSEEFGSQGELPTHPELLDWLARELIESGWDTRALLKTIVTSSTYQQSSLVSPEAAAADPDNRWLARGPRVRLSAEMVRDQALKVAGLLSSRMYGPPVKPPQPNLGLTAAFGSSTDWQTSQGEDRYRRAIYTTWRRSNPYPSMATFDAPNREVCTLRRNRTNTPLQALVTMNDPVYVEAAQALARVMLQHPGERSEQVALGFERCVLRQPSETEMRSLLTLYEDLQQEYVGNAEAAAKLATDPLGPLPEGLQMPDAAAMTVVASVLLNLDEMMLKR